MLGGFPKSRKAPMTFRTVRQSARPSARMSSAATGRIGVVIYVGRLLYESVENTHICLNSDKDNIIIIKYNNNYYY